VEKCLLKWLRVLGGCERTWVRVLSMLFLCDIKLVLFLCILNMLWIFMIIELY